MYFSISANTSFELSAIEDIDIGSASCKDNNLIRTTNLIKKF